MDEIKRISNNTFSQNVGESGKDNFTLLKDKYAKFLSDMQKSEMNNSIKRFENELAILYELIAGAEKRGDKAAVEEYTKKAEEIEKKISSMTIEVLPAMNNGIFFRPAINIVPDVNDGSEQEKIYALSKYYTIAQNGEEYPLFTKKEIKEFLKDEKVYNSILNLCSVTRENEDGTFSPAFDGRVMKRLVYEQNVEITQKEAQRLQEFANIKHTPYIEEKYFFDSLSDMVEIVKDDTSYENAKKLLDIKNIDKKQNKEEIYVSVWELLKYSKSDFLTEQVTELLKYRFEDDKESRPIVHRYELDDIIKNSTRYQNAKKILELSQYCQNSSFGTLSQILENPHYTNNCIKLLEMKNSNDEVVFQDFFDISRLATSSIDLNNEDIQYLMTSLSEITDDEGKRVYSASNIRERIELTKKYPIDDILRISNLLYRKENGEIELLFTDYEANNVLKSDIHRKEHILNNAEKLVDMTYTTKDGIEASLLSKEFAIFLLLHTAIDFNDKTKNFFELLIEPQKIQNEENPNTLKLESIITEYDIRRCPNLCIDNWTNENLKILSDLLELTKIENGIEEQVFTKNDLLIPYVTNYFPKKVDDNYYKKIVDMSKLINNTQQNSHGNAIYPILLLEIAKNNDFEIDDKFKANYKKFIEIKSDGNAFLGSYDAMQCCIKNIDIAKMEKLSTYKNIPENNLGGTDEITFNFDKYSIQYLLKNEQKIDTAISISEIKAPNQPDKSLSFFDGRSIIAFLEKESKFRYDAQFEENLKNILKEINKDSIIQQECSTFIKENILKAALYNTTANALIKNLKEYKGDIISATQLSNFYDDLEKTTFERINTLRNYYTYSSYDNKYIRAFLPEMAKNISKDDALYENVMNFIKNCETKQDEKNVVTQEIGHIAFIIEQNNIKVDNEFLENYNNLMSVEFNGEKFLREASAVELLQKKEMINDVLSLSEFKKTFYNELMEEEKDTYTFNKFTLFSFMDNPKLIEPAKKLASIKYNTAENKEMSVLSGHSILNIVRKLSSFEMTDEFFENLKSIIDHVEDDNYKTFINDSISEIADKCLYKPYTEDFIKTLKLFNGDLELSLQIANRKNYINNDEIELMAKLAKYQKYDEKKKMYKSIFDERTLENLAKNKADYDRILQFLEETSKTIDNRLISKFDIGTINKLIGDKELCNTVINVLPEKIPKEHLSKYEGQELINAAKFIEYLNKENINELNLQEKKKLINLLIKSNIELFGTKQIKIDFPLLPTSTEEYCTLLPKLVKSIGIETKPISDEAKNKFLNNDLFKLSEELKKVNFNKLEITQKISTENFVEQIQTAQQKYNISDKEMKKVFDYFAFEIKNDELVGYPANLQNGKKLEEITDPNTKQFINEVVRKIVVDFTENNPITTSYGQQLDSALNNIIKVLPELHTIVSKPQHKTHSYDVLVHSLKVMKEIVENPKYKKLKDEDKQILMISSLLHDITKQKGSIDKTHPIESSFDAFFICKKLNLSKEMESKIYDLIKNHDWTEKINNSSNKEKACEDFAFEFRNTNLLTLANIFSTADLKAVQKNNQFYNAYKNDLEDFTDKVSELIYQLQDTQPLLPNTIFPKASEVKDGKGVYRTADGVPIIKLNEVENLEDIGFSKGTTASNLKFLVHGLDNNTNLVNFNTFSMIDSDALLSTSYVINPYTEYHVFRPQGIILNCDTMDVHAGSNMDYGSGCKKDINTLKTHYIFSGANSRGNDRTFFSELLKVALGATDEEKSALNMKFKKSPKESKQILSNEIERVSKEKYRKLIEKFQNKSFAEIQNEDPETAEELIKIFNIIENCNRSHGRKYNEVLVSRPKIQGVFMFDTQNRQISPLKLLSECSEESINQDLIKFAKENNLPVIMFGD